MKIVLFLSLTLFLTLTCTSLQHKLIYKYNPEDIPVQVHTDFINWKNEHKKNYETTKEYLFRLQNFYENYLRIVELKLGYVTISYEGEKSVQAQELDGDMRQEIAFEQLKIDMLNRQGNWQAEFGKYCDLTRSEFVKKQTGINLTYSYYENQKTAKNEQIGRAHV